MASKNVLAEAINKLTEANKNLRAKLVSTKDKAQIRTICEEMQKNESMILDYKFRLKYE